jgi:CDP-diacylglycerol pyrophosphatase
MRYAALVAAAAAFLHSGPVHADPDALWKIVHEQCVPAAAAATGTGPCAAVDLERRVAVLKDRRGAAQFLLIPTDRVSGIESAAIFAPDAPNYWAAAWAARRFMAERAGRPLARADVSLAVNSALGRSQDQLHIHIDCVAPDVRETLRASQSALGPRWTPLGTLLKGHRYRARRLDGADLALDPFALLAEDADAKAHMGDETLVVLGWEFADGEPGFILLADRAGFIAGDRASGEELQDHDCAALQ